MKLHIIFTIIYLNLHSPTSLHNMEPTASLVRNHYSQKNQKAPLESVLGHSFKNSANLHWRSNVWTSNSAFEYGVGQGECLWFDSYKAGSQQYRSPDQSRRQWRLQRVHIVFSDQRSQIQPPAEGPTSSPAAPLEDIMKYKGSTPKETEPCWYCHFTHCTSQSVTSSRGCHTTAAQTPKVNHQHIRQVWPCICWSSPFSGGWWGPDSSPTKRRWRSQHSSTPTAYIWGSETVLGGTNFGKDSMANYFRCDVLDSWWCLETSAWSAGLSAGTRRCLSRYTI